MREHMDYRLAFILPESRHLLGWDNIGAVTFPRVSIPMWQRPAEQLTRVIQERWRIKTVVLNVLSGGSRNEPLAVIEVRNSSRQFEQEGLRSIDPGLINSPSFGEVERHTLVSILSRNGLERDPFSCLGWIDEAQQWIRNKIPNREFNFTNNVLQLNVGGGFALVRLGTDMAPAYWLKAVGAPNNHEFQITKTLAECFPEHLPAIVAMRDDWHAWVMEEADQPFWGPLALPLIERAVADIAEFQTKSIPHVAKLLSAGCLDRGIAVLEAHLSEVTEYLEDAMGRQTSTRVPRIKTRRLRELECVLRDACFAMHDLGIPDALIHNDINLGNILLRGSRCVFTDWAEGYVGNPVLTFQQLLVGVIQHYGGTRTWISQLKELYKTPWLTITDEEKLDRALVFAPLLAAAAYLYGRGDWLLSPRRHDALFQGYCRSVARYMDRTAREPELIEALCR